MEIRNYIELKYNEMQCIKYNNMQEKPDLQRKLYIYISQTKFGRKFGNQSKNQPQDLRKISN